MGIPLSGIRSRNGSTSRSFVWCATPSLRKSLCFFTTNITHCDLLKLSVLYLRPYLAAYFKSQPYPHTMSSPTPNPSPRGPRRGPRQSKDVAGFQSKRKSVPQIPRFSGPIDSTSLDSTQQSQEPASYESQFVPQTPGLISTGTDTAPIVDGLGSASTPIVRSDPVNAKAGKAQKARVNSQRTSSSPVVRADTATSRSGSQSSSSTPVRPTASPMKTAYAGPTFHASPAPSALPMPSFFSKSVPEVNSDKARTVPVDEDASETGGDCLRKENAQITEQRHAQEESPLDIFFKADRHEKAERRKSSAPILPSGMASPSPLRSSSLAPISSSTSLSDVRARHHSRHPTDDSIGGMFALEMDGASTGQKAMGPAFATPYKQRMEAIRSNTAPSNMISQTYHDEEQRKAKTKALKMLLLTPEEQRPASASTESVGSSHFLDSSPKSVSASPSIRSGNCSRYVSGPPGPVPPWHPSATTAQSQHRGSLATLGQSSPMATTSSSPRPRPPSSGLRQEVMPSKVLDETKPSAFSSLPSKNRSESSTISQNNTNAHLNGKVFLPTLTQTSSAPQSRAGSDVSSVRNFPDIKTMEDDLRRILKLDMLGNAGAKDTRNGVLGS